MMIRLVEFVPDAEALIALEPDELGLRLLPVLNSWPRHENLHLGALVNAANGHPQAPANSTIGQAQYPKKYAHEIEVALREAWAWLAGAALILVHPNYDHSVMILSRKARRLAEAQTTGAVVRSGQLNRSLLDERLQDDVWSFFHRGKYDTAVFEAMKAVEIAVREASEIEDVGVKLVRRAFHPQTGVLTDMASEEGEREARMHLFVGALGSFKNPHSHRTVRLENPDEAAEMIVLANLLLRIVDARLEAHHERET